MWRPVGTWSGQDSIQTDSFLSETGLFRVHWESQSHGGYGYLAGYASERSAAGPCWSARIDASGVTWKVSLEEGLRTLAPNPQSD